MATSPLQLLEVKLLCLDVPGDPRRNTTEYSKANTQLKIMQWNAEGVIRKKTELERILKKENIDICCIQETHLQKDKRFRVRGYQCFRNDREGDQKKGVGF